MSETLDLKLLGQGCPHAVRLCDCISYFCKCEAPKDYSCGYKNAISDSLVMCKRYDTAINKLLAKTQQNQR